MDWRLLAPFLLLGVVFAIISCWGGGNHDE